MSIKQNDANKTEFIVLGTKVQRDKLSSFFPVNILDTDIFPSKKVRNLGVIFDSDFSFSDHITSVCKSCFVGIRDLRRIRRHLSRDTAVVVANALISSRLDYCNSLFRSLSSRDLRKLQCVQNTLARVVTRTKKYEHITPALKKLHWLPIKHRIIFKTATIIYKFLSSGCPAYFSSHLSRYTCAVNTRRSNPDKVYLNVPIYKPSVHKSKVHFHNSLCVDGSVLWNSLPHDLRSISNITTFRRRLKTHLFQDAYPP